MSLHGFVPLRLAPVAASLAAATCLTPLLAAHASTAAPCDGGVARTTFNAFLLAFNHGDRAGLDALFARSGSFRWYSVAPPFGRTGPKAQSRATLLAYFAGRHSRSESLRLVRFRFASTQTRADGMAMANFNGDLTRKARDLRAERRGFKATIVCGDTAPVFIVVSIGTKI